METNTQTTTAPNLCPSCKAHVSGQVWCRACGAQLKGAAQAPWPGEPSAPLLPLSAPVGVSGVTLPATETCKATLTFASYEMAKEFRTAWTRFSKRGTSLSPRNANGGATLDLWGVTEQEKPWIEAKIAELGGNSPAPSPAEPVTPPASPVDSVGVPVSAQPYLTPERDSDPLGVYRFSFADDLERRFDEVDNSDDEDGSGFEAIHAENNARLAEILTAVNSHAANLAKIKALEDVAKALVEGWPNSGAVINVHASIFSAARAALALPSA